MGFEFGLSTVPVPYPVPPRPQGRAGDYAHTQSSASQRGRAHPANLCPDLCRRGDGKRRELHEPVSSLTVIAPIVPLLLVRDTSRPVPVSLHRFPLESPPFSFPAPSAQPKGAAQPGWARGVATDLQCLVPGRDYCSGVALPAPALSRDAPGTQTWGEGSRRLRLTSEILGGQIPPGIGEGKLTALLRRALPLISRRRGFIGVWSPCRVRARVQTGHHLLRAPRVCKHLPPTGAHVFITLFWGRGRVCAEASWTCTRPKLLPPDLTTTEAITVL